MHSEFKIMLYIEEQYIITTGSQCPVLPFVLKNHMCRHINLLWCATIISSAAAGATLLEVQEAAVEDEDESTAPSDTLITKK